MNETLTKIDEDALYEEYNVRKKTLYINMVVLHDFDIDSVKWKEAFYWFEEFCKELGIEPTRMSMERKGDDPYKNVKTKTYRGCKRSLEKSNFADLCNIGFSCMYHKDSDCSDAKAQFDINAKSLMIVKILIEESIYPFSVENYSRLGKILHELTGAKYGYYHRLKLGQYPELYSMGSESSESNSSRDLSIKSQLLEWEKLKAWKEKYWSGYINKSLKRLVWLKQDDVDINHDELAKYFDEFYQKHQYFRKSKEFRDYFDYKIVGLGKRSNVGSDAVDIEKLNYHEEVVECVVRSYATDPRVVAIFINQDVNKIAKMKSESDHHLDIVKVKKDKTLQFIEIEDIVNHYKPGDLREIYKLNFLTRVHLYRNVFPAQTLEEWILSSSKHGNLERLSEDFWSWSVDAEDIDYVTTTLNPSGIIICP